ncbi:MAG: hypothetical protein ACYDCK_10665 [Thermoplasmatota archaeon]
MLMVAVAAALLAMPIGFAGAAVDPNAGTSNANTVYFTSEADMKAWQADFVASHAAASNPPAGYSTGDALKTLVATYEGKPVATLDLARASTYAKGLKDVDAAQLAAEIVRNVLVDKVSGNPNQATFDELGAVSSSAQAIVGSMDPALAAVLDPHNFRGILGIYTGGSSVSGYCDAWNCDLTYVYYYDTLSASAFSHGGLVDTIVAQAPYSYAVRYYYSCSLGWWGWSCGGGSYGYGVSGVTLATGTSYSFEYPAASGEFATRIEASDAMQTAYDSLGALNWQNGREWTSASNTPVVPANPLGVGNTVALPGAMTPPVDTPPGSAGPVSIDAIHVQSFNVGGSNLDTQSGLGDLATAAPAPNYYGVQNSPTVPTCTPGTLPTGDPAPAGACVLPPYMDPGLPPGTLPVDPGMYYDGIHLIEHPDYGVAPGDATGVTAVDTAGYVVTGYNNFMVVRWHDVGHGAIAAPGADIGPVHVANLGIGSQPASFRYAAASYFAGSMNVDAMYDLADPIAGV